MDKFFIPTNNPEDWRQLLAEPNKHWKTGYSAKSLAYCWQKANDFPHSISEVFKDSRFSLFQDIEVLLAFPEYKVPLRPYKLKPSQNDIFILARGNDELISITVEGKVDEGFDEIIGEWKLKDEGGKVERLEFLCQELELDKGKIDHIKYQLLHRTASALIEAKRFNARNALMLVHIFEKTSDAYDESFRDYCQFLRLFRREGRENSITFIRRIQRVNLYIGWVRGEKRFLGK